ncbi:Gfo/Idh/MocA family protein [Paenibacillus periandrae]|uniref:Gfo/Idh/MocA family protein n=1 Tax=Paenibacillus periandrae TaxID=1761741 RepID=UPI001F088E20|nr:Gfo/Idh/MocA family oxidoreductase [Paenibacillus periandrae]
MNYYNAAVIGLGNIGLYYDLDRKRVRPSSHALAYELNGSFRLIAGVDVSYERLKTFKGMFPHATVFSKISEMLSGDTLDVVSICTPPQGRYNIIKEIWMDSNIRLLFCEKPIASSTEEALIIRSEIPRSKVVLPNLSRRYHPVMRKLATDLNLLKWGKVQKIQIKYTRGIRNTGSHIFDLVRWLVGEIVSVNVINRVCTSSDKEQDPTFTFSFQTDNNVEGIAIGYDDQHYYMFEIEIYCESGKIEIKKSGDEIAYYDVGEHPLFESFGYLHVRDNQTNLLSNSNMSSALEHIQDILDNGVAPVCCIDDAIVPLFIAEAIERSYQGGNSQEKVRKLCE